MIVADDGSVSKQRIFPAMIGHDDRQDRLKRVIVFTMNGRFAIEPLEVDSRRPFAGIGNVRNLVRFWPMFHVKQLT
ncbi:MAG: hypothetical protein RL367_1878 [Pseudomonadota bacterium]|jgi:hypothetical protein